jgi:hypothetical protein
MTEWRQGDDDEEELLSDTEGDMTVQSRDAGESLADTEADLSVLREGEDSDES